LTKARTGLERSQASEEDSEVHRTSGGAVVRSARGGYQVDYNVFRTRSLYGTEWGLRVTVKGKPALLAVVLVTPHGETETRIINTEDLTEDNVETRDFPLSLAGSYTLMLKAVAPEKVLLKETVNFELEKLSKEVAVQSAVETILRDISKAEEHRRRKEYAMAKRAYMDASARAGEEYGKYKDRRIAELVSDIDKALQADDIRLGTHGYVFFEGRWVTPVEKKRLEENKKKRK